MDRFFGKLQPEKLVLRNNYFFQVAYNTEDEPHRLTAQRRVDPDELSWATSLGCEGTYEVLLVFRSRPH